MNLREFAYECFMAGKMRGQTLKLEEPSANFAEWYNAMQEELVVEKYSRLNVVVGRFYSDKEISVLKEKSYQDGFEDGEL